MAQRKNTKQHVLGQYMTTEEVALDMCQYIKAEKKSWRVFDPACGDGVLLEAAAVELVKSGVDLEDIKLIGFDIDQEMINKARNRLNRFFSKIHNNIILINCDTLQVLQHGLLHEEETSLLKDVNIILGNPPYGKKLEVKFFEECNSYFNGRAELIFLLPMSFVDAISGVKFTLLKGRPLGVTTGHVIIHHQCGAGYTQKSQKDSQNEVDGFRVLTGVKLYAVGDGDPPQSAEIVKNKPYSSSSYKPGWLPCLRTGDIGKFSYEKGRLWVNYGKQLAHPKEIDRFEGPRIFVRRVPIWSDKTLGATYISEKALCAGDVLVVKHVENDPDILRGLCVFLNSPQVSEFIITHRPSVGHRDSFPKISAKDLVRLFREMLPKEVALRQLANKYPEEK
ncbi:TPA: N-6 DNA methylase [Aeromonas veronii]